MDQNIKKIKKVSTFSFNDFENIEKIIDEYEWDEINNIFINTKNQEQLKELIFHNLKIKTIDDELLKGKINDTLKRMIENYYAPDGGINNKLRYFSLSELFIPLNLVSKYDKLKWVYWNQCFNFESDAGQPVHGHDCVLIYDNNKIVMTEIKSSQRQESVQNNIKSALKELETLFDDSTLRSLIEKIDLRATENDKKILYESKVNDIVFLISMFNVGTSHNGMSFKINEIISNNPISIYEVKVKNDK